VRALAAESEDHDMIAAHDKQLVCWVRHDTLQTTNTKRISNVH